MLKKTVLASLLVSGSMLLSACDEFPTINEQPSKSVNVYGRTWAVSRIADEPPTFKAIRDNNNLNPYGPPAKLRTTQAIRAMETATGCKVILPTMYQNMSGHFFSQMSCPTPVTPPAS